MGTLMFDCSILTNCASSGGGGIANCTLNSCVVMGNVATFGGGMAAYDPAPPCVLNNCTVVANYATNIGGGTYYGSVFNCVVYYNAAPVDPNIFGSSNVNNCCTLPLPGIGTGNVTNAPLFIDLAVGNLDLQPSSPCINAGSNLYVTNSADFLGRPRISGGIVDIGAYEYQFHTLDAFHAWLQQYGLPTDGSADFTDPDGDGMNNWQEWLAGTNPTNAASVLRIQTAALALQGQGIAVTWLSVSNREYFLQRSTNSVQRWEFSTIRMNIPGSQGTTTVIDTNLAALSPVFYRVGVHQ
jgi:hypothetical protein